MNDPIDILERPDRPVSPRADFAEDLRARLTHEFGRSDGLERRSDVGPPVDELDLAKEVGTPDVRLAGMWRIAAAVLVLALATALVASLDVGGPRQEHDQAPVSPPDTTPTPTEPTADPTPLAPTAPGWSVVALPVEVREGAAYAASDEYVFAWGGYTEGTGADDGFLVDLETLRARSIPSAPIDARYLADAIWTGQEFVVFGGLHRDIWARTPSKTFIDGAAYDPATNTWRAIPAAPVEPGYTSTAAWDGNGLIVWVSDLDERYQLIAGPGQLARFDLGTGQWTRMGSPSIGTIHAELVPTGDGLTLIGGTYMRDRGQAPGSGETFITIGDAEGGAWSEPVAGPDDGEGARGFTLPDGTIGLLAPTYFAEGGETGVHLFDGASWRREHRLVDNYCWDIASASGSGRVYLKACGEVFELTEDGPITLLGEDDAGATSNTYGSGFVATPDGRLVVVGSARDPEPIVGVFTPSP